MQPLISVVVSCLNADIVYGSGNERWFGDISSFEFNMSNIEDLGWSPCVTSENAVDN